MKKRMLALFVCLSMVLSLMLSGCGGFASQLREQLEGGKEMLEEIQSMQEGAEKPDHQEKSDMEIEGAQKPADSKESGSSKVQVPKAETINAEDFDVQSYLYEDSYSSICFLVVTNNSQSVVSIVGDGTAMDAEGSKIGVAKAYFDVLGPGETTMKYLYFSDVKGVDSVEYNLEYELCDDYRPVLNDLSVEKFVNEENVVVRVTNEGDSCAEFLEAHALFFDAQDNVVGHASTYLLDSDDELKPGKNLSAVMNAYDPFDHAEVYFSGRSTGKQPDANPPVTDEDFEVEEYFIADKYSSYFLLTVTNHSEIPVEVRGNAAVEDAEGNLLTADTSGLDILGPGETSLLEFYLSDAEGADSIEYELSYNADPLYTPIIGDLSCEVTPNSNNAIVAVTNDGTVVAEFIQAHALFFDAQGQLVHYASQYVIDDDSQIKPGKTCVEQINLYGTAYDHVEVYLSGRADT